MHKSLPLLLVSLLTLSACQTSSLTESEQASVPETSTTFDGTLKDIDTSQSVISFVGKSNIINHEGKFTDYTPTVTLDPLEPANLEKAGITIEIDIQSVEVDSSGLREHLLREDFFDAATYPVATFASSDIKSIGGNKYEITGMMTVKGVALPITFQAEITNDYLTAHFDLPRKDYGIGNDNYGDKLLDETVPIDVKLVFRK